MAVLELVLVNVGDNEGVRVKVIDRDGDNDTDIVFDGEVVGEFVGETVCEEDCDGEKVGESVKVADGVKDQDCVVVTV